MKKILIAEDEKALSHALELKLKFEGFETAVAHNGQECLNLLKSETFAVILLDLMMPIVDGFHVLEKLKAAKNTIPVIVLSNLSQHEDEARVMELGAARYFIKSNTPLATIVDEIKRL